MRPDTSSRRSLLGVFIGAAALAASSVAVPAAKADLGVPLPVLWEGRVQEDGQPADAEVVAFLRPPAEALVPGVPLVPLARTRTDSNGHFTLRSLPTPDVSALTPESGWTTVMVAAFTDDGISLAMDSVAWKDRWVTDPSALLGDKRLAQMVFPSERPNVLVTVPMKSRKPSGSDQDEAHAPSGAGSCWLTGAEGLGHKLVDVGELHLDQNWGGVFSYTNTRSSSFQIGVSHEGAGWKAGGSVSMSKNSTFGQPQEVPSANHERYWSYKADMDFKKFDWACNKGYPDVHHAATVEPIRWRGGMEQVAGGEAPRCNRDFITPVLPHGKPFREKGQSMTLHGAISVAGFSGSMTSGFSDAVRNEWHNPLEVHRNLCGSTDILTANTRVRSLP